MHYLCDRIIILPRTNQVYVILLFCSNGLWFEQVQYFVDCDLMWIPSS
jgi:hypothetical protein